MLSFQKKNIYIYSSKKKLKCNVYLLSRQFVKPALRNSSYIPFSIFLETTVFLTIESILPSPIDDGPGVNKQYFISFHLVHICDTSEIEIQSDH